MCKSAIFLFFIFFGSGALAITPGQAAELYKIGFDIVKRDVLSEDVTVLDAAIKQLRGAGYFDYANELSSGKAILMTRSKGMTMSQAMALADEGFRIFQSLTGPSSMRLKDVEKVAKGARFKEIIDKLGASPNANDKEWGIALYQGRNPRPSPCERYMGLNNLIVPGERHR